MGVEDNYYQIPGLTATSTFYEWVTKENTDIIPKLNRVTIYGASAGDGNIGITIGSTGNSYDAGDLIVSLNPTISGITISGDLRVNGNLFHGGNSADNPFVSTISRVMAGTSGATQHFEVGNVVRGVSVGFPNSLSGLTWALANNEENSKTTLGMVKEVGVNYIDVVTEGFISGLSGLTNGSLYYVSATGPGTFVSNKTETVGQVVKPIIVGMGVSSGIILNQLGTVVADVGITGPAGATAQPTDPIFVSKNQMINGNYDVWQRGTVFAGKTGTNRYLADRWAHFTDALTISSGGAPRYTASRFTFASGQVDVAGDPAYYLGVTFEHGGSGTTGFHSTGDPGISGYFMGIENRLENPEKFLGETIRVDGYMKSSTGCTLSFYLRRSHDGTTYDTEEFGAHALSSSWQSFGSDHIVAALGKTASLNQTEGYVAVGVKITELPTGDSVDMANFRVFSAQGATLVGTPFREKTDPEEERLKCSRFYQRTYGLDENDGDITTFTYFEPNFSPIKLTVSPTPGSTGGQATASENYYEFPVEMIKTPKTLVFYSPHTGVSGDGYNRTAKLDMRLSSGTQGFLGQQRVHIAGQATLLTTLKSKGVIFNINSGAVVLDNIYINYVADADFSI